MITTSFGEILSEFIYSKEKFSLTLVFLKHYGFVNTSENFIKVKEHSIQNAQYDSMVNTHMHSRMLLIPRPPAKCLHEPQGAMDCSLGILLNFSTGITTQRRFEISVIPVNLRCLLYSLHFIKSFKEDGTINKEPF